MASYNNSSLRTYFASNNSNSYNRIEGIGAIVNFPIDWRIEFGTPVFRTQYYVKGGNVIYKGQGYHDSLCVRQPRAYNPCWWPLSITEKDNKSFMRYSNNHLYVNTAGRFTLALYSTGGNLIFKKEKRDNYSDEFSNYPAGIYILSLQTSKGVENRKILIR